MNINELKPDGRNYNKGTDKGRKLVKRSLKELGAGRSVLVDKDGNIIAGNKTVEAAKALGYDNILIVPTDGKTLVAVQRTDVALDSEQGRALALADNATASAGLAWDFDMMAADGWGEGDLTGWGVYFEQPEKKAVDDEFEAPEIDEIKTDIQRGDIIEIGPHRLMCGDSTSTADVERLMGWERAELLISDPPYGIGLKYVGVMSNNTNGSIHGDNKPFEFSTLRYFDGCVMYVFGADYFAEQLPDRRNLCVWAKAHTEKENQVFGASFETFYRSHKSKREIWFENRIRNLKENEHKHPTQKPVSLISRCINDSGTLGLIVDNYCGSGTTMVASHQLDRRCYAMEIDPKYCQVIVDRMRKLDPNIEIKKNGQPYPVTAI